MDKVRLIQFTTTFCCAGIEVDEDGKIVGTAPIFGRWMGKNLKKMIEYYKENDRYVKHKAVGENGKKNGDSEA